MTLHDTDFYRWTEEQTAALRRLAETRPNEPIDWENLIEEIESLGDEQEHAIESHMRIALVHLLKLLISPDLRPRRHWKVEVLEQRARLLRRIRRNPSLRPQLPDLLESAFRQARRQAALKLDIPLGSLPEVNPFTLDQVLDEDWFPEDATHA
jgi:hypothetical protein